MTKYPKSFVLGTTRNSVTLEPVELVSQCDTETTSNDWVFCQDASSST